MVLSKKSTRRNTSTIIATRTPRSIGPVYMSTSPAGTKTFVISLSGNDGSHMYDVSMTEQEAIQMLNSLTTMLGEKAR